MSKRVSIFSSGVGSFSERIECAAGTPTPISLTVKRDHLSDVLASLAVTGRGITVSENPSFRSLVPAPECGPFGGCGGGEVALSPNGVWQSLATIFSGQQIQFEGDGNQEQGTLIGCSSLGSEYDPATILNVQTADGKILQVNLKAVESFTFTDEGVQRRFAELLADRRRDLDSASVVIDLQASSEDDGEANVRYSHPLAPFKLSYRVNNNGGIVTLTALGEITNNTPRDWEGIELTLVNASLIDFSTDLGEASEPTRERIKITPDRAQGSIHVDRALPESVRGLMPMGAGAPRMAMAASLASFQADDASDRALAPDGGSDEDGFKVKVEPTEVGSFFAFEAPDPVSVKAGFSSLIPLFEAEMGDGESVLYFDPQRNGRFPYQAVTFTNDTGKVLGRGVVAVFVGGVMAGKHVLDTTGLDARVLIPHAVENRVEIVSEPGSGSQDRFIRFEAQGGTIKTVRRREVTSSYTITNGTDDTQAVMIVHRGQLGNSSFASDADADVEAIVGGARITVTVNAKEVREVLVTESIDQTWETSATDDPRHTLAQFSQFFEGGPGLVDDNELAAINSAFEAHRGAQEVLRGLAQQSRQLDARQSEIRENLAALGAAAGTTGVRLATELDTNDQALRELNLTQIPAAQEKVGETERALKGALAALSKVWEDDSVSA